MPASLPAAGHTPDVMAVPYAAASSHATSAVTAGRAHLTWPHFVEPTYRNLSRAGSVSLSSGASVGVLGAARLSALALAQALDRMRAEDEAPTTPRAASPPTPHAPLMRLYRELEDLHVGGSAWHSRAGGMAPRLRAGAVGLDGGARTPGSATAMIELGGSLERALSGDIRDAARSGVAAGVEA